MFDPSYTFAAPRMPQAGMGTPDSAPDYAVIGLLLAIVGCFLLANSILFRNPRTLVAQFFGGAEQTLTSIRAYIFHRVQVNIGFLLLLISFGAQLLGHYRPPAPGEADFPVKWVGLIALAIVVLEVCGWLLSRALFRRYVKEYFRAHPPNLEADVALSRELGQLFGIASEGDDSVQSYLLRIRQRLGILGSVPERGSPRTGDVHADAETEKEFGFHP